MERKPPSSIGEFIAIVKRRKYWIIVPFFIFVIAGLALTRFVPRTYQSKTTILIVPQEVSTAYVKSSASDVANRLQRIGLAVMQSRGLTEVIDKLNLYPKLRQKGNMAQILTAMRKDLTVSAAPDSTDEHGNMDAFNLSYIAPTPLQAQQATKQIANLFIDENTREWHQRDEGTDVFLAAQVAQAKQQLVGEQARIQAFKNAHIGSLPEQAQANLALISQYQAQLQTNSAAIDQDKQQRVYLESVLNVNPNGGPEPGVPAVLTPLQIELAQKKAELAADLLKYTPEHPDIIRLQHDIAALKIQVRHAPKATATTPFTPVQANGPSQIDLLRGQLLALNTEIQARNARQTSTEQKIAQLQSAISAVPSVQTEFSSLDSEYQEMQKNYNALLEKQQEATMVARLDQHDESEQFIVLNPANFPRQPYFPNPVLLDISVVIFGLFIGFVCAAAKELRDDTIHDADEAAAYLKLPVIAALPKSPPFSDEGWKIRPAKT